MRRRVPAGSWLSARENMTLGELAPGGCSWLSSLPVCIEPPSPFPSPTGHLGPLRSKPTRLLRCWWQMLVLDALGYLLATMNVVAPPLEVAAQATWSLRTAGRNDWENNVRIDSQSLEKLVSRGAIHSAKIK